MAYFAGNAYYITHAIDVNHVYQDYKYMCGAGVHIANNHFEGNAGLKRHNGGASVHRCLKFDGKKYIKESYQKTSNFPLAERNKTDTDVGNFTVWYDDP